MLLSFSKFLFTFAREIILIDQFISLLLVLVKISFLFPLRCNQLTQSCSNSLLLLQNALCFPMIALYLTLFFPPSPKWYLDFGLGDHEIDSDEETPPDDPYAFASDDEFEPAGPSSLDPTGASTSSVPFKRLRHSSRIKNKLPESNAISFPLPEQPPLIPVPHSTAWHYDSATFALPFVFHLIRLWHHLDPETTTLKTLFLFLLEQQRWSSTQDNIQMTTLKTFLTTLNTGLRLLSKSSLLQFPLPRRYTPSSFPEKSSASTYALNLFENLLMQSLHYSGSCMGVEIMRGNLRLYQGGGGPVTVITIVGSTWANMSFANLSLAMRTSLTIVTFTLNTSLLFLPLLLHVTQSGVTIFLLAS